MPALDRFDPETYETWMTKFTGQTQAERRALIDGVVERHVERFGQWLGEFTNASPPCNGCSEPTTTSEVRNGCGEPAALELDDDLIDYFLNAPQIDSIPD